MLESGRSYSAGNQYRYGFNGKENDTEVKGEGNQQDYGMRIYDPRLGRFLSIDPITAQYPELTPFQFASNRPIDGIDFDGLEFYKKVMMKNGKVSEILYTVKLKVVNDTKTMNDADVVKAMSNAKAFIQKTYSGKNAKSIKVRYNTKWEKASMSEIDEKKDFYLVFVDDAPAGGNTREIGNTTSNKFTIVSPKGLVEKYKLSKYKIEQAVSSVSSTISHEIGHGGGLRHPDDPHNPPEIADKMTYNNVMYYGDGQIQNIIIPLQRTEIDKYIPKSQTTVENAIHKPGSSQNKEDSSSKNKKD